MPSPTAPPPASAYWPARMSATGILETTIGSVLRDAAGRAPDHVALLTRFTPGMRVAVWAPNRPEWVILEFGAALAGLTLVTVNPAYQGEELAHVLGHSEADGLFM